MDGAVREQPVSVAINLSLIEVGDYLSHGLFDGGPDRCKSALEKGVPTIFVPGNIDFIVAGPIDDAKARFPGKRYHIHNAALTAVRAEADEFKRLAEHMAGLIKEAKGPSFSSFRCLVSPIMTANRAIYTTRRCRLSLPNT